MEDGTILAALTLVFGGGTTIGALIAWWANRDKVDAEADSLFIESVTNASTALLKPLTERVTCLEGDLATERRRRMELNEELEKAKRDSISASQRNIERITALEQALLAKDKEIASLQLEAAQLKDKVAQLEAQLEALEQTPVTKRNNGKKPPTGPLPQPVK